MKQSAEKIGEVSLVLLVLRNGFTLVELAVSMVVIGILLGLGMSMVGPLMTSIKVRESKENLGAAVESVNSWASGNNKLPDKDTFKTIVKAPADAWGRDLIYVYAENLAPGTATKDTICGRRSTLLKLVDTNISATAIDNVAYVVFSKSDDADSNTIFTNGTLAPASGTLNAGGKINTNAYLPTASTTATTVTTDGSSDLVRWVTLDELRTKVGCQGAQLKIVNNELPFGNVGGNYSAIIYPDGGVGSYQWCIQVATLPGGIATTPTGIVKTDCSTFTSTAVNSVTLAATPISTGSQGSHSFTVFVKDADNNTAQKTFVLTIHPN